jgi:hypothetical protein
MRLLSVAAAAGMLGVNPPTQPAEEARTNPDSPVPAAVGGHPIVAHTPPALPAEQSSPVSSDSRVPAAASGHLQEANPTQPNLHSPQETEHSAGKGSATQGEQHHKQQVSPADDRYGGDTVSPSHDHGTGRDAPVEEPRTPAADWNEYKDLVEHAGHDLEGQKQAERDLSQTSGLVSRGRRNEENGGPDKGGGGGGGGPQSETGRGGNRHPHGEHARAEHTRPEHARNGDRHATSADTGSHRRRSNNQDRPTRGEHFRPEHARGEHARPEHARGQQQFESGDRRSKGASAESARRYSNQAERPSSAEHARGEHFRPEHARDQQPKGNGQGGPRQFSNPTSQQSKDKGQGGPPPREFSKPPSQPPKEPRPPK